MHDLFERFLHVFGLFYIILGWLHIKTQNRNSIFIYHFRVDLAIIAFYGKGFAATGHTNTGAIEITEIFFQRFTITAGFFLLPLYREPSIQILNTAAKAISRLTKTAPVFNMITTGEIEFFIIAPPECINMRTANT